MSLVLTNPCFRRLPLAEDKPQNSHDPSHWPNSSADPSCTVSLPLSSLLQAAGLQQRQFASSKRRRIVLHDSSASSLDQEPSRAVNLKASALAAPLSTLVLRPCHICHRRPRTRDAIESYADCTACGQRTCYICLRQCENDYCRFRHIDAHGENNVNNSLSSETYLEGTHLCSLCTTEYVDEDGESLVRCLDCSCQAAMDYPLGELGGTIY